MGRGIESGESVLAHESTTAGNIRRGSTNTPSWIWGDTRSIIESPEHELGALVSRSFRQDSNGNRSDACGVQQDGSIVQIPQNVNAECVDNSVRDQNCGIDPNRLSRSGCV